MACLLSPEGKLTPAHQMHSFKTCAHSFGHLNGLASIDVFSAPRCEGRSLAKLPHLEHMSPGVWTESNSAGTHNGVLSSLSKVSSWFILTSYKLSLVMAFPRRNSLLILLSLTFSLMFLYILLIFDFSMSSFEMGCVGFCLFLLCSIIPHKFPFRFRVLSRE